jgi:hypothetical protein
MKGTFPLAANWFSISHSASEPHPSGRASGSPVQPRPGLPPEGREAQDERVHVAASPPVRIGEGMLHGGEV